MSQEVNKFIVYVKTGCRDCLNARDVFNEYHIIPDYRNILTSSSHLAEFEALTKDGRVGTPRIIFMQGREDNMKEIGSLVEPDTATLTSLLETIGFTKSG